jgi:putative NADH-flavin reductase
LAAVSLLTGENGKSAISAEDWAVALIHEFEQGRPIGPRITVASAGRD